MIRPFIPFFLVCSLLSIPLTAQTTASTPQPLSVLQSAYAAMAGNATVSDVTLTGTAQRIAGSDDETGTVTYKAVAGCSRLDLNLSKGTRSEIRGIGAKGPGGNWIGPDGVAHQIADHNLVTDDGWFLIFTLRNLLSSTNSVLTYVGTEAKGGVSVIHISASQQLPNAAAPDTRLWQRLTQMDIYLDASSLLPVALGFSTHPDDNALLDIPVEFRFSDYRAVGSLNIPFHVQKSLNGSLFLDVQFQSASLDSGLASGSSIFVLQ